MQPGSARWILPAAGDAFRVPRGWVRAVTLLVLAAWCRPSGAAEISGAAQFQRDVQPILTEYCYDCHADGVDKGGIAFDELDSGDALFDRDLWTKVMKNLRANLMPPQKKSRPTPEERKRLENWIKYQAFEIDPKNPDPGRVTIRRLNRVEYHNTIRDLIDRKSTRLNSSHANISYA